MDRTTRRLLGMHFVLAAGFWIVPAIFPALVTGQDAAHAPLVGNWRVVELVDDGRAIPQQAIPTWIASGGQFEVIDNTLVFTSSADGKRHARTFEVDPARYPKEINLYEGGRIYAHGIYQFDQGRLVICATPASTTARPTDFTAPQGSRRVLMVSRRAEDAEAPIAQQPPVHVPQASPPAASTPAGRPPLAEVPQSPPASTKLENLPPPPDLRSPPGNMGRVLTDAEVRQMLLGTWKYNDAYGSFFLTLDIQGTFQTYREAPTTSAFQQVFVRAPISSGTWMLNNGQVTFRCTGSVHQNRVNQQIPFMVRSISENDLVFVDHGGQVAKAVRVR
jgi:uncharacterized protein (TIGR03067 family)